MMCQLPSSEMLLAGGENATLVRRGLVVLLD